MDQVCGCDQMVVFARPKLFKYTVWVEGGVHSGECAHEGVCTAHCGACEHTTHLLTTGTCQAMQAQAKSDT